MTNLVNQLKARFTHFRRYDDVPVETLDSANRAEYKPCATHVRIDYDYSRDTATNLEAPNRIQLHWTVEVEGLLMELIRLYLDAAHLSGWEFHNRFLMMLHGQINSNIGLAMQHQYVSNRAINITPIETHPVTFHEDGTYSSPNPVNWEESGEDERDVPEVRVIHGLDGLPTQPDSGNDIPIEHRVNFMSRRMLRHEAIRAYNLERQLKGANEAYDKLDLKLAESKDEYDRLTRHCSIITSELNIIREGNEKLRTGILGAHKSLELRRKLADANGKIRQLEESIHTLEASRKNLIEVHEEQQRLLAERFNQINELTDKVRARDEENQQLAEHNVRLVNRIGTIEGHYSAAKAALAKTLSDFENVMQRLRGVR